MPGKVIAVGNAKADPTVPTIPQALPMTWYELSVTLLGFRQNVRMVQTVNPDHTIAMSIAGRFRFGVMFETSWRVRSTSAIVDPKPTRANDYSFARYFRDFRSVTNCMHRLKKWPH